MEINSEFRAQMEIDIEKCETYPSRKGSGDVYREMCVKYSLIDPEFEKSITFGGKAYIAGEEPDYRKELKAASARLKGLLMASPKSPIDTRRSDFSKLVADIPMVKNAFQDCSGGIKVVYNTQTFAEWRERLKFLLRDMWQDDTVKEMLHQLDNFNGYSDEELFNAIASKVGIINENINRYFPDSVGIDKAEIVGNKVFIVHGHDEEAKITVARTLEQLELKAVILHEQPDEGKTIIEKLETYSSVAYAIILYTECDIGRAKELKEQDNRYRARQNVVFEHGLFIGALGRNRVCALVKGNVEKPGDIDGVVYVPMDEAGAWKLRLCKNIKAAGIDVDMNKLN